MPQIIPPPITQEVSVGLETKKDNGLAQIVFNQWDFAREMRTATPEESAKIHKKYGFDEADDNRQDWF